MPNQETNMLLRNTLAEEREAGVPTGVVPRPAARPAPVADPNQCEVCGAQPSRACGPAEQPRPVPNAHPAAWPLVMVDMASRDKLGRERYGTPLQPHNGRDMLRDVYEELLDAAVYIRAAIYERDGK